MKKGVARRCLLVRGARLVAGTVALSLPGVARGISVAEAAGPTSQQTYASRAVSCYNAMQQYFYMTDGTSLYRETYPWCFIRRSRQPCPTGRWKVFLCRRWYGIRTPPTFRR